MDRFAANDSALAGPGVWAWRHSRKQVVLGEHLAPAKRNSTGGWLQIPYGSAWLRGDSSSSAREKVKASKFFMSLLPGRAGMHRFAPNSRRHLDSCETCLRRHKALIPSSFDFGITFTVGTHSLVSYIGYGHKICRHAESILYCEKTVGQYARIFIQQGGIKCRRYSVS